MRRGGATFHELVVKDILRGILFRYGYKLRCQHCFLDKAKNKWYIADFYIPELSLIIEIDGSHHKKVKAQVEYDKVRTAFFHREGFSVERFDNQVVESFDLRQGLLDTIKAYNDINMPVRSWSNLNCSVQCVKCTWIGTASACEKAPRDGKPNCPQCQAGVLPTPG